MINIIAEYTVDIPEWAVCSIEYGDETGLSPADIMNIGNFLETINPNNDNIIFGWTENYNNFNQYPEFGLPCKTVECNIIIHK